MILIKSFILKHFGIWCTSKPSFKMLGLFTCFLRLPTAETPQVSAEYQPKNSDQLNFLLASEGYPHKFLNDLQSIN